MASSQPTQMVSVLSVQLSDQKGNQQPKRNKKKGKNNHKGGNKNENGNFMTRIPAMPGGTSSLNLRLIFLANCVRRTTSLTCALIWKMPQDSYHRAPTVLTNPLPHNQNMNSRTNDPHCASGGDQNLLEAGHGCINIVRAAKVVTHAKDYGSSQSNLGK